MNNPSGIMRFMNKKKYPTGYLPVNFNAVGKILIIIGVVASFLGFGDKLLNLFNLPNNLLIVGLVFVFAGLYLLFVVPKE